MVLDATRLAALVLLASPMCGCSVGRDFVRPGSDDLVLGKTTLGEILERYGTPVAEQENLIKDQRVKTLKYYYSQPQASGWAHNPGAVPDRSLAVDFVGDRLVAYVFHSTYEKDHTDFDDSKVDQIKKGETSLRTVVGWLGEPHSRVGYPHTDHETDLRVMYNYFQKEKVGKMIVLAAKKVLLLTAGADGIITDIKFTKSSSKDR
jgi:hypothetical protein